MAADPDARREAKAYVDSALAERARLGYAAKVPKKAYGRAVEQAAGVFAQLRRLGTPGKA